MLPVKAFPSIPSLFPSPFQVSSKMSTSNSPVMFIDSCDNLDRFVDHMLSAKPRIRFALIEQFSKEVNHPAYTHLLKTMDIENYVYVIGYLRSQRMVEMHNFVDKIVAAL